ncbi:MAG: hypothetical protein R2685_10735 [Candidatus Nitrosocosmicus sp.]|nr:hypothetical protein [Candidatus Nitrosocosmicus sp.]
MRTAYALGYQAENDLYNKLLMIGFIGRRSYKSQGPFDLMMFRDTYRPLLIEVKYYKEVNDKVIGRLKKKVNTTKLIQIAQSVQAYPLLAFKMRRLGYLFYRLDIDESYMIKYKDFRKEIACKVLNLPPSFS